MAIVETTGTAPGGAYEGREALREYERENANATADITVTRLRGLFSWQAIVAGAVAALGLHLLLMMLGMAFGFGATDPITDENPITVFTGGTAIAWSVSALISLWFGGWIAGRSAAQIDRRAGTMHGFLVWSAATVTIFLLLTTGIGVALGGAAKAVGQGLALAGKPATDAIAQAAKDAVGRHADQTNSFVSEIARTRGTPDSPEYARATREVGRAAARFFAADDIRAADARAPMVRALVEFGGKSEADATHTVDEWTTSARQLDDDLAVAKAKAETKARAAADKAAKAMTTASIWGFFAFLLGAGASVCGGAIGAKCARCKLDPVVVSA